MVGVVLAVLGLLAGWSALVALAPARADDLVAAGDDPAGVAQMLAAVNAERAVVGRPGADVAGRRRRDRRRPLPADGRGVRHLPQRRLLLLGRAQRPVGEGARRERGHEQVGPRRPPAADERPGRPRQRARPRFTVVGIAVVAHRGRHGVHHPGLRPADERRRAGRRRPRCRVTTPPRSQTQPRRRSTPPPTAPLAGADARRPPLRRPSPPPLRPESTTVAVVPPAPVTDAVARRVRRCRVLSGGRRRRGSGPRGETRPSWPRATSDRP